MAVEATWKATPTEKTPQAAMRPIRRPNMSPTGEAVRAPRNRLVRNHDCVIKCEAIFYIPKKVPAERIETTSEVCEEVKARFPSEFLSVPNSFWK